MSNDYRICLCAPRSLVLRLGEVASVSSCWLETANLFAYDKAFDLLLSRPFERNGAELDRLLFLGTTSGFLLTSFLMSAANVFGPMLLLGYFF